MRLFYESLFSSLGPTEADEVEIVIDRAHDGARIWINVDGECAFRAYRVARVTLNDRREAS